MRAACYLSFSAAGLRDTASGLCHTEAVMPMDRSGATSAPWL